MSKAPWYAAQSGPGLQHQKVRCVRERSAVRAPGVALGAQVQGERAVFAGIDAHYERGADKAAPRANRFRCVHARLCMRV